MLTLARRVSAGQRWISSFQITKTSSPRPKPDWSSSVVFGKHVSDHMLEVSWDVGSGWGAPVIKPYEPLKLDPAISALHYAVECYEELEAVKGADGGLRMFRPEDYFKRLIVSGEAVCLPPFDPAELAKLLRIMAALDRDWIPPIKDSGLYFRVNYFSDYNVLGVTRPMKAKIVAYSTPHLAFSAQGLHPVRLFCDETVTRTWPGGVGQYKIGANYACGIMHTDRIRKQGYQHMLWTVNGHVTEAGRMNFFAVVKTLDGEVELITPPLNGLIIPGVTRDCVLDLVNGLPQYDVVERPFSVDELLRAFKEKRVVECFGTGSRMFIVPVQTIHIRGKDYEVPLKLQYTGRLAKWLHDQLAGIKYGTKTHPWAMEERKCAHCAETAKYQCLKDNQYSCSQHCREHHLRHKFQSITEEYARRSALYTLFQRDISTLSQGLGLDRNFIERFEQKAEEVTQDFVESLEEWIAVHRKQLLELRRCAQTGDKSALLCTLVARLQANYAKPLVEFHLRLTQDEDN